MRLFITNALQFVTGSAQDFGSSDVTIGMKEVVIPESFKVTTQEVSGVTMAILKYNGSQWVPVPYPNVADSPCHDHFYTNVSTLAYMEQITCPIPQKVVSNT